MRVVMVEVGRKACEMELEDSLASMQRSVGGLIQAVYEPGGRDAALICNEEGKLLNLPLNRALRDDEGTVYDIISGTFFLCAAPPDSDRFAGLTDQQIKTYMERFDMPEMFLNVGGNLFVLPYL